VRDLHGGGGRPRQSHNVFRMRLLAPASTGDLGSRTLKDAMNEALRDWVTNVRTTYYLIGSTAGPHPYPEMVRDFQSVIGRERCADPEGGREAADRRRGMRRRGEQRRWGSSPPSSGIRGFASTGGGGGARPVYRENTGPRLSRGKVGVLHGSKSFLLQDANGQILEAHSISAGLDYPGVGPEHAWLKETGRAEYVSVTDAQALSGFSLLSGYEGIQPALESSPCRRVRVPPGENDAAVRDCPGEPLRPGRQGHGDPHGITGGRA